MSAGMNVTGLPARRAASISSLAMSPPPIATNDELIATIAAEVGESLSLPGVRPPHASS